MAITQKVTTKVSSRLISLINLLQSLSFEDEIVEGVEGVARAHAAVIVDTDEELDGVSVDLGVVVAEEFELDDFLEEDVEVAAAVAGKVVVLDHAHELGVGQLVDALRNLADQQLADLLLHRARLVLQLVDVEPLGDRREGGRRQLGEEGGREVRDDVPAHEVGAEAVGEHALQHQLLKQPRPHLSPRQQLLRPPLQPAPEGIVLVLEAEVLSNGEQLREGEGGQQLLDLPLQPPVHVLGQPLGLFEAGEHAGELLGVGLVDGGSDAPEQLLDPRLLAALEAGEDEEEFDILVGSELTVGQHLLRVVEDLLAGAELPGHEDDIHQPDLLLRRDHHVLEALELHLLPKLLLPHAELQREDRVLLQRVQRVHQVHRPHHAALEPLELRVPLQPRPAAHAVEGEHQALDLLGGGGALRPVEHLLDAALAQPLGDARPARLPQLAEVKPRVDLPPPLEEVVLFVLHQPLLLLRLLLPLPRRLLALPRLRLVLLAEEVGDYGIPRQKVQAAAEGGPQEFSQGNHTTIIVIAEPAVAAVD